MKKYLLAALITAGFNAGATLPATVADYMKPAQYTPSYTYASYLPYISLVWNLEELTILEDDINVTLYRDGVPMTVTSNNIKFYYTELEPEGGGAGFLADDDNSGEPDINDPGNKYPDGPGAEDHGDAVNLMRIDLMDYTWLQFGAYVLNIPEGIVANQKGDLNPEQDIIFWLYPQGVQGTFSWTEDEEVNVETTPCQLVWEGCFNITALADAENTILDGVDQDGNDVRFHLSVQDGGISVSEEGLVFHFDNIPSGKYDLSVMEATVSYEDAEGVTFINPHQYYVINVVNDNAGVKGFTISDKEDGPVYDLAGNKVAEKANLNKLPKGLYIVNGKKIIK